MSSEPPVCARNEKNNTRTHIVSLYVIGYIRTENFPCRTQRKLPTLCVRARTDFKRHKRIYDHIICDILISHTQCTDRITQRIDTFAGRTCSVTFFRENGNSVRLAREVLFTRTRRPNDSYSCRRRRRAEKTLRRNGFAATRFTHSKSLAVRDNDDDI